MIEKKLCGVALAVALCVSLVMFLLATTVSSVDLQPTFAFNTSIEALYPIADGELISLRFIWQVWGGISS